MQQWYFTVVQGAVTIGLLVTAFMFRDNPHIPDLIIGAVISQWLREGIYVGQSLSRSTAPTVQVPVDVSHIAATVHPAHEVPSTEMGPGTGT
jgi:hypothetical protein